MIYDPEYYNEEALTDKETELVEVYDAAMEDAGNAEFIIDELLGLYREKEDTITKIQREIAEMTIDAVLEYMSLKRQELIAGLVETRDM